MRRGPLQLAWIASLLLVGCAVDSGQIGNPTPDAPPPPDAMVDAPPPITCTNATTTQSDGHHHPGLNCMAGNCHGPAGAGPTMTVAGTLYASATGPGILPYATITLIDATGTRLDLVSSLNGNFYTSAALVAPIRVYASKCPDIAPMVSTVQYGSCNGCHASGLTQGQLHLP